MRETALIAVMMLAIAFCAYVAGYFALSREHLQPDLAFANTAPEGRFFSSEWLHNLYVPASKVEGVVRGRHITTGWVDRAE